MKKIFNTNSQSLDDWLSYLESIHPKDIEMGLERVRTVAVKMNLLSELNRVILVGGTNGKGSTSAYLEQLLLATNTTVGVFSSPHFINYNERLRINGSELADSAHIEAFRLIEQARADIALTYFEVNTLSALYLMKKAQVEYLILEVGLGGRLDSTNIVDADMAIITSIDIDHQQFLGNTRELVAYEKSGIFRPNQQVICGDINPPLSLLDKAKSLNCQVAYKGTDFSFTDANDSWTFNSADWTLDALPPTKLPMTNAATALAAFYQLGLSLSRDTVAKVISNTGLMGRLQQISHSPDIYLDVAHNPEAGGYLASWLAGQTYNKVHCVCAMLADKDRSSTLAVIKPQVDQWYIAGLDGPRGASADELAHSLNEHSAIKFDTVLTALSEAKANAHASDVIVVFGSFFTVAQVLENK